MSLIIIKNNIYESDIICTDYLQSDNSNESFLGNYTLISYYHCFFQLISTQRSLKQGGERD